MTPVADTDAGDAAAAPPSSCCPGEYSFVARADGRGAQKFTRTIAARQARRPHGRDAGQPRLGRQRRHDHRRGRQPGAADRRHRGDATGPSSAATPDVAGAAGHRRPGRRRAARRPRPGQRAPARRRRRRRPGRPGRQNRFTALRQFEILTCCGRLRRRRRLHAHLHEPGRRLPRRRAAAAGAGHDPARLRRARHRRRPTCACVVLDQPVHGQPDLHRSSSSRTTRVSDSDCTVGSAATAAPRPATSAPPSCRCSRARPRSRRPSAAPGRRRPRHGHRPRRRPPRPRRRRPRRRAPRTAGFRSVSARPRGRGLRIGFSRRVDAPVNVDVFQQSRGRRVIDNLLVARFTPQDPRVHLERPGAQRQAAHGRRLLRALPDAAGRRAPRRPPHHALAPRRALPPAAGVLRPQLVRARDLLQALERRLRRPPGPPARDRLPALAPRDACASRSPAAERARCGRFRARTLRARTARTGCALPRRRPAPRRLPRDAAARAPPRPDAGGPAAAIACRAMSPETTAVETDQAAREATGAHPYGRYLEEFEVGAVYKHWPAKTVTEADDHLFCLITMNHHPLHINDVYAGQSQQGRNVVVGPLVYSLALGMSVSDVSGKAIANLATEELKHPAPVFHGDTLFCESEVLEVKESRSKTDRGTVRVHTRVLNQDGVLVAEFKRLVLVPRREAGRDARRRATWSERRRARALARRSIAAGRIRERGGALRAAPPSRSRSGSPSPAALGFAAPRPVRRAGAGATRRVRDASTSPSGSRASGPSRAAAATSAVRRRGLRRRRLPPPGGRASRPASRSRRRRTGSGCPRSTRRRRSRAARRRAPRCRSVFGRRRR